MYVGEAGKAYLFCSKKGERRPASTKTKPTTTTSLSAEGGEGGGETAKGLAGGKGTEQGRRRRGRKTKVLGQLC